MSGPVASRNPERGARLAPRKRHTGEWKRYGAFVRTPPELSIAWNDRETGARAWLVINSSRGGAAGGGTRMRSGLDPREVTYLAKAMELKFSICGPPIGGAKTGIDFDASDPRKPRVLERLYRSLAPMLRERYDTGGDLNVDELLDVLPAFERLGLHHPQEGVVRGHIHPDIATFQDIMERMDAGVAAPIHAAAGVPDAVATVADMITGYGVAVSVRRLFERLGGDVAGKRVLLEGFGNVGAACGLYLARAGARIVAIRDARRALVEPRGLDAGDIESLIRDRTDKMLPAHPALEDDARNFLRVPADIFVSAAISESVTVEVLEQLERSGVRVIASGSNRPFREVKIGSSRVAQRADRHFSILPDILANCGMARTFSYLMESNSRAESEPIFDAVQRTITGALDEVVERAGRKPTTLLAATLGMALDRIGAR
jgi:glutamate dehydrogenase (NAD(P)+)